MTKITLGLAASVLLCCAKPTLIPDPRIPHRIADEGELVIWVRAPDGTVHKTRVRALPGWWIASPEVVEEPTTP